MAQNHKRILKNETKYRKLGFRFSMSNVVFFLLMICLYLYGTQFSVPAVDYFFQNFRSKLQLDSLTVLLLCLLASSVILMVVISRPRKVYLVNFACYKSKDSSEICSNERLLEVCRNTGLFSEETLAFQKKVMDGVGVGSKPSMPKAMLVDPMKSRSLEGARRESEAVMIGAVDELLANTTGVKPQDIGVLIVNGGMFSPTPSLSAMLVNHYKLRRSILTYNIGGMGCSSSLTCIDLAQRILQTERNTYALVVSTDNLSLNWYPGNARSMVVSNCTFRMGGAAILLSNRSSDRSRSKYELVQTLRTHMGAKDKSYKCIFQQEDELQNPGVHISKDLTTVIGEVLRTHIAALGPLVLPMSEKLLYLGNLVSTKIFNKTSSTNYKPYVPDFKSAFDHFCCHVGAKPVLDEVEKNLGLEEWHLEPSRMTLYRFGNTMSSSVWYVLAYCEAKGRIRKGDKIWQVAFGSGVKCCSAVWRALNTVHPPACDERNNPWSDEIDDFPVDVSKLPLIAFFQN